MPGDSSAVAMSYSTRAAMSSTPNSTKKSTMFMRTKLVRNRKGRRFCLGLTCVLVIIIALEIVAMFWAWRKASLVAMGITSMSVLLLAAIWTFIISFAQGVFRRKSLNCLVY